MAIKLVSHVVPDRTQIHVWLGVSEVDEPPNVTWKIDGRAANPSGKPVLTAVREDGQLDFASAPNVGRVFTDLFEFRDLDPKTDSHKIEVVAGDQQSCRIVRKLPARVPFGPSDSFNLLLASCYSYRSDRTGTTGDIVSAYGVRPDLSLFVGDQVYLDAPAFLDIPSDLDGLLAKFEMDYVYNWLDPKANPKQPSKLGTGFRGLLDLAPCGFLPDDHEYWNNYPFAATPHLLNLISDTGFANWKTAAEHCYQAFQQQSFSPTTDNTSHSTGATRTIEVDPLSILLLDTRSQRNPKGQRKDEGDLLGLAGRQALKRWAADLVASASSKRPRFGVLVTGQSLFRPKAGRFWGHWTDYEVANYCEDYRFILQQLESISGVGLPVVCLTGDVHWGRILAAWTTGQKGRIYEVISSPLSLVAFPVFDQVEGLKASAGSLFGKQDPWPRHASAKNPPEKFGTSGSYHTGLLWTDSPRGGITRMRGNQAMLLRFSRHGTGLKVEADAISLHPKRAVQVAEDWTATFELGMT